MSKPTLALIPSGYKGGTNPTVYSILPNNGDGDFDFSRGSVATRVRQDGLIEEVVSNVPRLDYSDGGCPSLLLEPQRSNLIRYSEQLDNAVWTKTDTTVTANFGLAPNGEYTADKLTFTTTNDQARAEQTVSGLTIGVEYTVSFYIKSLGDNVTLRIGTSASQSGEFTDITATSEWQRFYWSADASSTSEFPRVQNISGISGTEILVWGCQYEQGSYQTSYIKRENDAVTRIADECSVDTPDGVTQIVETFSDDTTNTITTIPSTYTISEGKIKKVIMT